MTTANHYEISGDGVEGTLDTAGVTGQPSVSLSVDGRAVSEVKSAVDEFGVQARGVVRAIADDETVHVRIALPETRVDGPVHVEGVALVATVRSSLGGPALVDGPLQRYSVRMITATASVVES